MKFLQFLDQLTSKERRSFGQFLRSPYFNQKDDLSQLYDQLVEYRYTLRLDIDRLGIWQRVYGVKSYDDQGFRLKVSELFKLLERYLVSSGLSKSKEKGQAELLEQLRLRQLDRHFDKSFERYYSANQASELQHADTLKHRKDLLAIRHKQKRTTQRLRDFRLQEYSDLQDIVYISEKLRHACLMLSHQRLTNQEYDYGLLDAILKHIADSDLLGIPAISLYYHFYLCASGKQEDLFDHYLELMDNHIGQFPIEEQQDFYLGAINVCIRRINQGSREQERQLFELYRDGIESKVLFTEGRLSRFTYRNAAAVGLRIGETKWVRDFIEDYKQYLDPKFADSIYKFNKARLLYHEKEYDEALELLRDTSYADQILSLAAQVLKMKIYYECDMDQLLESFIESTEKSIRRLKNIGYQQENYLKVTKYMRLLNRVNRSDKSQIVKLQVRISEEKGLLEKKWMLRMLEKGVPSSALSA